MINWKREAHVSVEKLPIGEVAVKIRFPNLPGGLHVPLLTLLHPVVQGIPVEPDLNGFKSKLCQEVYTALRQRFGECRTLDDVADVLQFQEALRDE